MVLDVFNSVAIPAGAGVIGVLLGSLLAFSHARHQSKLAFIEKQLSEFYSPLVGIRKEIAVLSEFRKDIDDESNKISQRYRENGGPDFPDPELEKSVDRIEYNNKQLTDHLIPAYRRMVDHFREKFWLAEYKTREHFPVLVQFVEKWNRDLAGTLTPELSRSVDVREKNLYPLYEDLEKTHDSLRERLRLGNPQAWSERKMRRFKKQISITTQGS